MPPEFFSNLFFPLLRYVLLGVLAAILAAIIIGVITRKVERWSAIFFAKILGKRLPDRYVRHANANAPACPRCGQTMVLRTKRKDGSRFWGCPKFPACRGIRQVA